jgi:DNA-binding transcriptional MocR family regulator
MIPGLTIDPDSASPVYRQIADGIRAAAREGLLKPGWRLPPTRALARRLGVNRNTVVAAYDELLAEGLIHSTPGKGTFLLPAASQPAGTSPADGGHPWQQAFARAVRGPGTDRLLSMYRLATSAEGISFAGSYPAADLMPVEPFGRAMAAVLRERGVEVLTYGPTAGWPALRETIAREMRRRGSAVDADGILVTHGSQQALDLVFRSLLDPGDPVVLEDPTYTGALSVLASLGAHLVPVPMDAEGIRPDLLALALERQRPRVLYLQPTFQNPTSSVMSEARRREVLALAARYQVPVVEDDWAGDLRFEGHELPTLHALDGGRQVIYLSTFSKKLLPGLRVGWLAAPPPVLERLVALKQIQDCGTSPLVQAALHAFLVDGGLENHLERVRPEYRRRRDAMLQALERRFPPGATWTRPEGGLFLWVTLPRGADSNELFSEARDRGVLFSRGEVFQAGGTGGREHLRLSFASVSREQIDSGIGVLGSLVRRRIEERGVEETTHDAEALPVL